MADQSALSNPLRTIASRAQGLTLCLGLGGGSDAVSACWMAQLLEAHGATAVHYGNTRPRFDKHVTPLSPHIGHLPGPRHALNGQAANGSTEIDRSLPKGPGLSPLVVLLGADDRADAETRLAPELDALDYALIVGVDTGGDVLSRKRQQRNRDRIMLKMLLATRAEVLVAALAPGSDGSRPDRLMPEIARIERSGGFLGSFDLAPWAEQLCALSVGLPERRTPRIVLRAIAARKDAETSTQMQVPRGSDPWVPLALLTCGYLFRGRALL